MTDLASAAPTTATLPPRLIGWLALALPIVGGVGGLAVGMTGHPAAVPEPTLVLLLRFMAVLKGSAALGAAALALWRLRRPIETTGALGYGAGLALMAIAPGLVWSLAHVAAGAACFHAGLVVVALGALRDDAIAPAPRRARARCGSGGG